MWGVLKHLSDYAVARYEEAQYAGPRKGSNGGLAGSVIFGAAAARAHKIHPFVVALTHRRVLDFGGGTMNKMYSGIIANAETCEALLQLDPLDEVDREDYLCLSLRVAKVPLSVSTWVSDVANGNPQYIEICAALIDKHMPPIIERQDDPNWSIEKKKAESNAATGGGDDGSASPTSAGKQVLGGANSTGKGADNGVFAVLVPNGVGESGYRFGGNGGDYCTFVALFVR